MSRQQLEKFAASKKMTVYGQVKNGVDASRKKTSLDWGSILTKRLSSTAKLALVGCVVFYTATAGYGVYKSMEKMINDRAQTIENICQSIDGSNTNNTNLNVKDLKGHLGR